MDSLYLQQLTERYLQHCRYEKGLDEKTIKAYKIDLAQFHAYVASITGSYEKECLQAYIVSLHEQYSIKTTKRKIASLKAYFNYLEYEAIIANNPFSRLRLKLHEPLILPRTIPLATIRELLHCAYRQVENEALSQCKYQSICRDVAVLELLFATGMRISELCNLHDGDVDLTEGSIRIYGKGAKERFIQIGNTDVLNTVTRYYGLFVDKIADTGWFFVNRLGHRMSDQSVRNMINKYCRMAGINLHITPHMFRHSFATLLLEEDVDIRYIQQLLGHSSIVTTQIYTHVSSKKQRDILTSKHPRNKMSM